MNFQASRRLGRRATLVGLSAAALALGAGRPVRAQATPLTLGFIPVLGSSQAFVIDGEGWAKQAGIDLKLIRFDSGPAMIQALASGQLDVYVAGFGPVLVARAQGIDVRIVAATAIEELGVLARGSLSSFATEKLPLPQLIAKFRAEEGRKPKIATQPAGSVPDAVLRYWLGEVAKVELDTVEILGIGIDAAQQAFLSGAVDAAVMREPTVTLVRDRDAKASILATGRDMFPNQPGGVMAFRGSGKAAAFEALLKLHIRATKLIVEEPKRAATHIHKTLGGGITPLSVFERALASPFSKFTSDPNAIYASTGIMQEFQVKTGVLKQAVPLEQAFDLEAYRKAAG